MTGDHRNFSSMKEKETPHKVELGDNKSYADKRIGKATIKMESHNSIHLSNVLYVLGLKKNLVSISFLEEKGYRVAFVDGKFLVWSKDSKIENDIVFGTYEGRLYKLPSQNIQALVHEEINPSELWHRSYSHPHYQSFPSLKHMAVGILELQLVHESMCRECALAKNIEKPFPSSENRSKWILDLIHLDVFGPMTMRALGGSLYYVTFIDDFSRKTWLYLLKAKEEVFRKFQEFKAKVENLSDKKIKTIRSDNGE
jgi:hypothetical protein